MPASLEDFDVISTIGTGSYGTCRKIRRKRDGKILVWKEMDYGSMSESEKQMLVSEVNLLRELRHKHIVKYHDRIIDRSRATIYIIMEYCPGGDLASIIARHRKDGTHVTEEFAWKILSQTTLALRECHRRKNGQAVLHRDLKPANVFLDTDSNVKLGDFGLARVLHHETSFARTYVGTPYYMSPELVNNQSYNDKSDVWSLGCMLYELCALAPPFVAANQTELNHKIRAGEFSRLPHSYSSQLDLIIRKMLQVEVSKRPSIESLLSEPELQRACQRPPLVASGQVPVVARAHGQKENILKQLEALALKEKELERRERNLAVKEKLVEDKLKRANELLQTCHYQETSGAVACPGRKFRPAAMPGPSCNKCPRVCATPAQGQTDQWKP
ncbi:serine/threonine-protein kinase Nek2-like isoform X1 [Physella acuta]|uniref:serine/threonine-protein kinase Nek2-like isoform X1 n=1 Tax=Physella acuta TaxID=109671 RepID=UPI0027DCBD93|nr:serine/threonine-protein kinase Nek2-like isoform X1 [Physella acuta]XP_059160194.1 serine/threonine-protein kinase Nek2-like isoform X1 [Physella acuta]XP_059160195.1 serine/threonine-protein kinase Nek2-like isoform X1 [Physella acuta]XP_059160197.1 serine/threonine-protein kinase Nek2-like isoform X1 [Physella acuta]XP_059160198.1 serine/threonine-protein kinase Nek2-like isoform X1 [Physella acuta]XP_059160199.1 serine/threonine-protein kinase Nek2-like isoform X1 [Physella acuta]XP_05